MIGYNYTRMRNIFRNVIELLFPQDIRFSIYNTIDVHALENRAIRTTIEKPIQCIAPFIFSDKLIHNAVYAAKYHSNERAAQLLGEILAPFVSEVIAEKNMFQEFLEPILIPIPLHEKKMYERGFNQSERIARSLCESLYDFPMTLVQNVLVRKKETSSQTKQTKAERHKNMHNAFTVRDFSQIQGKDILLLDDVVTTGATLTSAKSTLQKAGARNILCVAVAH